MAGTFNLKIVTPEREVFNGPVIMVSLPGADGSFGVQARHAPLVAALDPGLVQIEDVDTREMRLFVGGGFFQVAQNQAIILADSAELATDIDVDRAREAETRARSRLTGKFEPEQELQRERAELSLRRARARLRVAAGR